MGLRHSSRFFLLVLAFISFNSNASWGFECVLSGNKVRLAFPVDWQIRLLEYDPTSHNLYVSRAIDKKGKHREVRSIKVDEDMLLDEIAEEHLQIVSADQAQRLPDAQRLKSLKRTVEALPVAKPHRGWILNVKGKPTFLPAGPGEDLKRTLIQVSEGQYLASYQVEGVVGYLDLVPLTKQECAASTELGRIFVPDLVRAAVQVAKSAALLPMPPANEDKAKSSFWKKRAEAASLWFDLLLKSSLLFEFAQQLQPSANDLAVEFSDLNKIAPEKQERAAEYDQRAGDYLGQVFALVRNANFFETAPQYRLVWTITSDSYSSLISDFTTRFEATALKGVSDLKGFSTGHLRGLIRSKIRRAFGEQFAHHSSVDAIQDGKNIRIVRVSNTAVTPQSRTTPIGFFYEVLEKIDAGSEKNLRDGLEKNFSWQYNSKPYTAKIKIRAVDMSIRDVLPESRTFDLSQLRKDGVVKGMILVGSNMADMTESLTYNYKYFFEKRGYKFEAPKKLENVKAYVQTHIAGSEAGIAPVDYLAKDAHLDKYWDLLLKISKDGFVHRGVRAGPFPEEILLVTPVVTKKPESVDLQLREFAEWFRARDLSKAPKLIYLNGSCVSHEKARREVMALRSGAFQVIPTSNLVYSFTGEASDVQAITIDQILKGGSFSETREKMSANNRFYRERSGDTYVFPDENLYSELVTRYFKNPIDVQVVQTPEE